MATEEAEPNLNEPSAAYIEELMSMRENRTIKVQSKERTKLKERANTDHSYVEENRQPEKRNIYQLQQQQQPQAETVQDTPEPRKVAVLKQAKS